MSLCLENDNKDEESQTSSASKSVTHKKNTSKRLKATNNLAPDLIRYLASYNTPTNTEQQDIGSAPVVSTTMQPICTTKTSKYSNLHELHSRMAEELHVFLDSIIVLLIFDRSGYVSQQEQLLRSSPRTSTTGVLQDTKAAATEDIRIALQRTLQTTSLFPEIDPDEPMSVKLEKLHQAYDAAMIQGKVSCFSVSVIRASTVGGSLLTLLRYARYLPLLTRS